MEIERKYIISKLPKDLNTHPSKTIAQGYISTSPVIRIRKLDQDYILTVKGKGLLRREEFELNIEESEFLDLSKKVDGIVIHKERYRIPYGNYTIELDIFHRDLSGLILAEVEFPSIEEANTFIPPDWFGKDVTDNPTYQNSSMSKGIKPE